MLDREFGTDALAGLRKAVLRCATACGMPKERAIDVIAGHPRTSRQRRPSRPGTRTAPDTPHGRHPARRKDTPGEGTGH